MAVAYALEQIHRIVVDTVDRKHDNVRTRKRRGEHPFAVFYTAVVHDKIASRRFHQLS